MENLNAEQIKKALERCTSGAGCVECPRELSYGGCFRKVMINALTLVKSQEQKIKELTEENERLSNRITCQVVLPDEKIEEIKNDVLARVELDIKAIQADTVRNMQELFNEIVGNRFSYHGWYLKETIFPEIVKELTESEKL